MSFQSQLFQKMNELEPNHKNQNLKNTLWVLIVFTKPNLSF